MGGSREKLSVAREFPNGDGAPLGSAAWNVSLARSYGGFAGVARAAMTPVWITWLVMIALAALPVAGLIWLAT